MKRLVPALLLALLGLLAPSARAGDPTPQDVLGVMRRVADWQLAHPSKHAITDWTHGPYFLGLLNLHQVSQEGRYRDALEDFGGRAGWGPGRRVAHADDHAVLQAWLEAYRLRPEEARLAPTVALFPRLLEALAGRPPASVRGGTFTWYWCDALFMSPPVWVHLSDLTGDPRYLEWADREWWTTTDVLYDPEARLYYRDNRYFGKRTESGRKVFWSRGNGWVVGGLVHVLDRLPAGHPSRARYLALYHDMMHALLRLQGADGLVALDPDDPDTMVVSTDAHPATGEALVSQRDGRRHHELFRGRTRDGGATWTWTALTHDSTVDNLRPVIPSNPGGPRVVLWCRGDLRSYGSYRLDVCALTERREEAGR